MRQLKFAVEEVRALAKVGQASQEAVAMVEADLAVALERRGQ